MLPDIRPISDMKNKAKEVERIVNEPGQTIILTKNGYPSMVVMSYATYLSLMGESENANQHCTDRDVEKMNAADLFNQYHNR